MQCCKIFILLLALTSAAYCKPKSEELEWPWLTGPLLTPSAVVVPKGNYEIEPYIFFNVFTGFYNEHWKSESRPNFYQLNPLVYAWFGITSNADISVVIPGFYNWSQGASDGGAGDPTLTLDLQLADEKKNRPAIKLSLSETFPVGKYQHLSPDKFLTDATGFGTFSTTVALLLSKIFKMGKQLYWSSILSISDTIPTPVKVHGLSFYQGGKETKGTVYPGNLLKILYGMELSLTKNWAYAMDIAAFFASKTKFSGKTELPVGFPSSIQLSLAPAIEYNWSEHLGFIAGTWFTIAGRNSRQFVSGVAAITFFSQF